MMSEVVKASVAVRLIFYVPSKVSNNFKIVHCEVYNV